MLEITIRGSQCKIKGLTNDLTNDLEAKFSYEILGHEYSEKFKQGKWSGRAYCFSRNTFSIGLLRDVLRFCESKGETINITDFRKPESPISYPKSTYELYPYQSEIANKCVDAINSSIQVSTGGGKTLIAADFIRRVGRKSLFITPSVEILYQAQTMLSNYLQTEVGIIGDTYYDPKFVTVGTWQTLGNPTYDYSEYLSSIDTLVIDECHHIGADVLKSISKKIGAKYRLGMSGTAFREDGKDLEIVAATGPLVQNVSYSYLIENGYLTPPFIKIIKIPKRNYNRYTTYQEVYEDYVLNNEVRNQSIIQATQSLIDEGRKVLVFVTRIEHGQELSRLGGHEFVYADHPERRTLIDQFKSQDLKCLISTSILQEGFDLPVIDGLVLASPMKSLIATIQRIGRSLRKSENKQNTIIIDTYDQCKYLYSAFQRRLNFYKSEKSFVVEPFQEVETKQQELDEWAQKEV